MNGRLKVLNAEESTDKMPMTWLCTFNDMMTLLMVFFVLIFSLSTIDVQGIHSARIQLQSGLGLFEEGRKTSIGLVAPLTNYDIGTDTFEKQIEDSIESLDSESGISFSYTDMGIIISLEDSVLFQSGSADINSSGFKLMEKITATILNRVSNDIRIEGHTDTDPIHNDKFLSNWELSTARAVNVLKYMIKSGNVLPKRLSAVGYGETRPLFPSDSNKNKKKNRRVELVIITE